MKSHLLVTRPDVSSRDLDRWLFGRAFIREGETTPELVRTHPEGDE
jgi:hypothetical protein